MLVDVAGLDGLAEGVPAVVDAAGKEIVLVRWRERVYALRNLCPHMSQSFEQGGVRGRAGGEVGDIEFDLEAPVLSCPWHQFHFDLASGQCLVDPKLRVRTYPVTLDEGRVLVETGR
jgi:nitrite reductase (NADH) small subunit